MDKKSVKDRVFFESKYSCEISGHKRTNGCMREEIVQRHFATGKELLRHLRNEHSKSGDGLDMKPFQASKPTSVPIECPATGCKMTYKQIRWWLDNMKNAQPQFIIVDNDNVTEETTTELQSIELSGNTVRQNDEAEFQFQLCEGTYKLIKSAQNHCSTKHRWLYTKNCSIGKQGLEALIPEVHLTRMEVPYIAALPTPPSGSHPS